MAGFWAGFGTTLAKGIEERKQYARDRAAKRQEYLQTYGTKAIVDREEKAQAALGIANSVMTYGIDKADVAYVLNTSGIQGLVQLKTTLEDRDDLTAEDKKALIKKAKDYVADNPDVDLTQVINKAYGLYKGGDNPVKRESNALAAIFGLDNGMMEDEVLDDIYINGMTGRDLYRVMGTAPKLTGGQALDLNLPGKPATDSQQRSAVTTLSDVFESGIDARIRAATLKLNELDPTNTEGVAKLKQEIEDLETLKGKSIAGFAEYAAIDPSFLKYAASMEAITPGILTRNTYAPQFNPVLKAYMSEDKEETPAVIQTQEALGEEPTAPIAPTAPRTPKTHIFDTAADFNKAVADGTVQPNDTVTVAGKTSTYTGPSVKPPKAPGLAERFKGRFDREDIKEVVKTPEVQEAIDTFKSDLPEDLQDEYDAFINSDMGDATFESLLSNTPLPVDIQEELKKFESEEVPSLVDYFKGAINRLFNNDQTEATSDATAALYGKAQDTETGGGTFSAKRADTEVEYIDTPPAMVDGDIASEVSAMVPTGGDRAPNNAGLMSRPSEPTKSRPDAKPDVMSDIDSIKSMVDRLHGAGSTVAKSLDRSESMTAADVTKLISKTKDLPKTDSRDTLLASLYELRDKLNNR